MHNFGPLFHNLGRLNARRNREPNKIQLMQPGAQIDLRI